MTTYTHLIHSNNSAYTLILDKSHPGNLFHLPSDMFSQDPQFSSILKLVWLLTNEIYTYKEEEKFTLQLEKHFCQTTYLALLKSRCCGRRFSLPVADIV